MQAVFMALESLTDRESSRRDIAAAELGDHLRGGALDADSAHLVVGRLVSLAVNDPVPAVRESALNSISEAFNHFNLPLSLVEALTAVLSTVEPELLAHALYIFGATHDPKARPLIESFLHHPEPDVREEARLAADKITASNP